MQSDQRPIGFWLKLVERLIDESFDRLLGAQHLSRRHWQVLNILHQGARSLTEIDALVAPFLDTDEPTTQPIVADLIARGWAEDDKGQIALTAAGGEAYADLHSEVSKNRQALIAEIPPQDYALTITVLEQMAKNLGWTEPGDAASTQRQSGPA